MTAAHSEQLTGRELLNEALNNTDAYLASSRRAVEDIVREDLKRRAELFRQAREKGQPPPYQITT